MQIFKLLLLFYLFRFALFRPANELVHRANYATSGGSSILGLLYGIFRVSGIIDGEPPEKKACHDLYGKVSEAGPSENEQNSADQNDPGEETGENLGIFSEYILIVVYKTRCCCCIFGCYTWKRE